jgi:hypothetical protein
LSELISEVAECEDEKRKKVRALTYTKSNAAKILLEERYLSVSDEKVANLRQKRILLHAYSRLIMGKKTTMNVGDNFHFLKEFGIRIDLEWPSISPDILENKSTPEEPEAEIMSPLMEKKESKLIEDTHDVDGVIADALIMDTVKRKQRRNTITGYSLERCQKAIAEKVDRVNEDEFMGFE